MSRAAAAQSSSTIPTPTPTTFLVLRDNPNGSSTALLRSTPFGHNSFPTDFGALLMVIGLLEYSDKERIENRKKYLGSEQSKRKKKFSDYDAFTSHGGGIFKISYAAWTRVLDFLIYDNTIQCIPMVIAPEHFGNSIGRATDLAYRLAVTTTSCTTATVAPTFFSKKYKAEFEFATLLDGALNADLKIVEKIILEASPENRQTFLFTPGKAVITHSGIERTGTPLQMALYSHDEKMVEVMKRHMDPAEFQRQCEAVFRSDYDAFLAKQLRDATQLCSELENAFAQASATDITNGLNHVPNTTSALQSKLNRFKDNLERYVRENPVHNPYILQRLFEIYDNLPYDWDKECLLSQQTIGLVEKLSSAIWLSHISDGVYNLGKNASPVVPSRGFLTQNATRVDVRSLDRLGVDRCIDIYGAVVERAGPWARVRRLACFKTYVEQKQQAFRTYYAASAIDSQLHNSVK